MFVICPQFQFFFLSHLCTGSPLLRTVLPVCFSRFSFVLFSFANSFAARSPCSTLTMDTAALSLEGPPGPTPNGNDVWQGQDMSTLTCPHVALSLHLHAPHRRAPLPLHEPFHWAFVTACPVSSSPSRLRAPRRRASCAGVFSACKLSFSFFY